MSELYYNYPVSQWIVKNNDLKGGDGSKYIEVITGWVDSCAACGTGEIIEIMKYDEYIKKINGDLNPLSKEAIYHEDNGSDWVSCPWYCGYNHGGNMWKNDKCPKCGKPVHE